MDFHCNERDRNPHNIRIRKKLITSDILLPRGGNVFICEIDRSLMCFFTCRFNDTAVKIGRKLPEILMLKYVIMTAVNLFLTANYCVAL